MTLPTQRFTQYPTASAADYADATTFLIANSSGVIKQASLEGLREIYGCNIQCASLAIASANVLQLNSTPLTIVAAQGAGTAIEVLSASVKIGFNSVAYATNVRLIVINSGADQSQFSGLNVLNSSVTSTRVLTQYSTATGAETQIIENADLLVSVQNGDPTAGDSDIEVFITYRVISI